MFHKGRGLRPVTGANIFRQTDLSIDVAHLVRFDVQTLNDVVRCRLERAIHIDECVSYVLRNRLGEMSLTLDGSKDRNKAI